VIQDDNLSPAARPLSMNSKHRSKWVTKSTSFSSITDSTMYSTPGNLCSTSIFATCKGTESITLKTHLYNEGWNDEMRDLTRYRCPDLYPSEIGSKGAAHIWLIDLAKNLCGHASRKVDSTCQIKLLGEARRFNWLQARPLLPHLTQFVF